MCIRDSFTDFLSKGNKLILVTSGAVGLGCQKLNIKTILVRRLNRDGFPIKFNLTLIIEKLISFFVK